LVPYAISQAQTHHTNQTAYEKDAQQRDKARGVVGPKVGMPLHSNLQQNLPNEYTSYVDEYQLCTGHQHHSNYGSLLPKYCLT
jgi:hypothetical protein